jgi:hypothetical protein
MQLHPDVSNRLANDLSVHDLLLDDAYRCDEFQE